MIRRIFGILVILLASAGCNRYDIDEILLEKSEISLTWKGQDQFIFDPVYCQFAHNSTTNEYRAFDDRLSDWFIVRCNARPDTEGQTLTADVTWTSSNSTKSEKALEFTVHRTDSKGRIWLWNKSKNIGIVIKNL
ncbi:MAG: hypothetical protein II194_04520 [Bacteroidales bacterium]|nr:hypothetical protein [Bacteroidales bacterium]